jgi:hypothetical protein
LNSYTPLSHASIDVKKGLILDKFHLKFLKGDKMRSKGKNRKLFFGMCITFLFVMLSSVPAFSANEIMGRLSSFSGEVLIKSRGSWGVEPEAGLPLYSDDKVVTKVGSATITLTDGAVIELKNNSNLRIEEREETRGFLRRVKVIKRRFRLLLGKMMFKTGTSSVDNALETPTMVCGLRGTAGTLSIGADGQTYIQFTDGGPSYTIGEFISGVADDVPTEIASMSPVQRAAFVAKAAADQAKNASAMAREAEGTPEEKKAQAQAAYSSAKAAELAAEEVKVQASIIIESNPDPEVVEQANEAIAEADESVEEAQEAQQDALDAGAEPVEPGTYEMPEVTAPPVEAPGFEIPVEPEPEIEDEEPASEV